MAASNRTNEMPFGVALALTLAGCALLAFFTAGMFWPLVWDRLAFVDTTANVLQTRPTEKPVKGGTLHGQAAQVDFTVAKRHYLAWVDLPKTTREREGPVADAVLRQAAPGDALRCYYDSYDPAAGVVLARLPLDGSIFFATLLPLLLLAGGIAGLSRAWPAQFPDGVAAGVRDLASRLPARFYVALLALVAIAVAFFSALGPSNPALGALAAPLILALIAGFVYVARLAMRFASVAFPSPEQRAAERSRLGHASGEPSAAGQLILAKPTIGKRLAYRLEPDWASSLGRLGCATIAGLYATLFLAALLFKFLAPLLPPFLVPGAAVRVLGGVLLFGLVLGLGLYLHLLAWRMTRELSVEVSEYPFVAGRSVLVSIDHRDRARLAGVRLALVCEESTFPSGVRGGKNTRSRVVLDQPIAIEDDANTGKPARPLLARLRIEPSAPPTLALAHEAVDWFLSVAPSKLKVGPIRYRVRVLPAKLRSGPVSARAPSREPLEPRAARLDEEPVSIWLDAFTPTIPPGASLSGGYAVHADSEREHPLRTVELSVLWSEGNAGPELGVCHYEKQEAPDGDDLPLYGSHTFVARLPADDPPSHEGPLVKVRWAVRLRLRYADGSEVVREMPFRVSSRGQEPEGERAGAQV